MRTRIEVGEVIPALVIDGVPDTPYVSGALRLNPDRGVELTIPYARDEPQFAAVQEWSNTQAPPQHLSVRAHGVRWELFDCKFSGFRESGHEISEVHVAAGEAVLGEWEGEHGGPLVVDEVESEIDGLYEWARLSSVSMDATSVGEGRSRSNTVVYTVTAAEGMTWRQGDATLSVSITWAGRDARGIAVDERAVLTSRFDEPRPFFDHLIEHRKFATFLSFLFGAPTPFRRHRVRDDLFTRRTLGGNIVDYPHVDLISLQTIREQMSAASPDRRYDHPILRQGDLGPTALTKWADNYDDWSRFILPLAGTYRLSTTLVEMNAVNAAVSLEALSGMVEHVAGEEQTYSRGGTTMATHVFRGLAPLRIPLAGIATSELGLARAIARNYNSIKHPDRGAFPDPIESRVLSEISMVIVRLNAVRLITGDDDIGSRSSATQQLVRSRQLLANEGLIIDDEGRLVVEAESQR